GRGSLLAIGTPAELARRIAPRLEVLLEVDPSRTDAAIAVITALDGMAASIERRGVVRVEGVARDRIPSIATGLVNAGIPLFRLDPHEPSLADAYFALQAPRT
ncbi:MAG: hypothetical protein K0S86_4723, partial [Geminicoccaceae bacterium]|nr:hypothetical protein [Geminicoccaceae bacterium]